MSIMTSCRIVLTVAQWRLLTARARRASGQHRDVLRARIVLAAARGCSNAAIARDLGVGVDTVRTWRRRFAEEGLSGLQDRFRSGRPRTFAAAVVAEVKALACALPAEAGTPLARWSCPDLAAAAVQRGMTASLSASTVRRWLATDAIKPWQHRSWIFPRDPDFAVTAAHALDLYLRVFDGEPLGENDYVISADEKPGVQARSRIHPSAPPGPGRRPLRVESEYRRHATLAYLAAYEVHHARVIGHCAPTTGIAPFTELVEKVMTSKPYATARRVF
jgi:transposase